MTRLIIFPIFLYSKTQKKKMKLFSFFVFVGENDGAVMSPNPAFMPTGFHTQLKPFVNPNPKPDYSDDPAFESAFEDEDEDNDIYDYDVADFLSGRIQTRRYERDNYFVIV